MIISRLLERLRRRIRLTILIYSSQLLYYPILSIIAHSAHGLHRIVCEHYKIASIFVCILYDSVHCVSHDVLQM